MNSSQSTPYFSPIGANVLEDEKTIRLVLNHPIIEAQEISINDFNVNIDDVSVSVESIELDSSNNRVLLIEMSELLNFQQNITIDHVGGVIYSIFDNNLLSEFLDFPVTNSLPQRELIPGKIEAEDYYYQSGLSVEDTQDVFGGQNIGSTDSGDYSEYLVLVEQTGLYDLDIRYASSFQQGILQLEMVGNDTTQSLGWFPIPITGDWQNWYTLSNEIELSEGSYTLKMTILQPGFNINWLDFNYSDQNLSINDLSNDSFINSYPNPTNSILHLNLPSNKIINSVIIFDVNGRKIFHQDLTDNKSSHDLNLSNFSSGMYIIRIRSESEFYHSKIFKK